MLSAERWAYLFKQFHSGRQSAPRWVGSLSDDEQLELLASDAALAEAVDLVSNCLIVMQADRECERLNEWEPNQADLELIDEVVAFLAKHRSPQWQVTHRDRE